MWGQQWRNDWVDTGRSGLQEQDFFWKPATINRSFIACLLLSIQAIHLKACPQTLPLSLTDFECPFSSSHLKEPQNVSACEEWALKIDRWRWATDHWTFKEVGLLWCTIPDNVKAEEALGNREMPLKMLSSNSHLKTGWSSHSFAWESWLYNAVLGKLAMYWHAEADAALWIVSYYSVINAETHLNPRRDSSTKDSGLDAHGRP